MNEYPNILVKKQYQQTPNMIVLRNDANMIQTNILQKYLNKYFKLKIFDTLRHVLLD